MRSLPLSFCVCLLCIAQGCGEEIVEDAQKGSVSESIAAKPQAVTLSGRTMGTTYSVKYRGNVDAPQQVVQKRIDAALVEVNQQMSTYLPDSELSRFNKSKDKSQLVSPATAFVVQQSIKFHKSTGGALDVTVGPLIELWKLNDPHSAAVEPTEEAIAETRAKTGIDQLSVDEDAPALVKTNPHLEVDLSAIAKGYGVDRVCEVLAELGIVDCMVEIGGEVRAAGLREDGTAWKIGVESPQIGRRDLTRIVPLANMAMATSGDYRNFRGTGEKAYTHIIDPRTAKPLPFRGISVTVLAPSCLEADALATALVVMGEQPGYDWCVQQNIAALFQQRVNSPNSQDVKQQSRATPRFEALSITHASTN